MAEGGIPESTSENIAEATIDESISENIAEATIDESISEKMAEATINESTSEPTGAFDGKHLYRCLGEDEDWNEGLAPKNPNANLSVNQHMRGHPKKKKDRRYKTQYISTFASLRAARTWAALSQDPRSIVKIDVEKMETANTIINLTHPIARIRLLDDETMRNYANKFEVVLVKGHIKSNCLTLMNPSDDDNVDHITEGVGLIQMAESRLDESTSKNKAEARINEIISGKISEARIDESTSELTGAFNGKFLYRCLRDDEDWNEGLTAKKPDATFTVDEHVRLRNMIQPTYKTQYISTCASLRAARAWADLRQRRCFTLIVKIDVEKMMKTNEAIEIINLTDPNVREITLSFKGSRNCAKCYEEVHVVGHIPSDC